MTCEEFSNTFDTLLNSYNIQAGFGEGYNKQGAITLDEYEKSVLLTQAQDIIVKSYFDRTLNNQGQGFDDSARRQVDFSSLIKVRRYSSTDGELSKDTDLYDSRGYNVTLEKNILFVLNEKLEITSDGDKRIYIVVPINYKEYDREMSKAYAQPLKKQAWRLFSNAGTGYDIKSEIIPIYGTTAKTAQETHYVVYNNGSWTNTTSKPSGTSLGTLSSDAEIPSDSRALYTDGSYYTVVENVTEDMDLEYVIRYIARPTPIVLRALPNELTIDEYHGNETHSTDGTVTDTRIFTGNGINCSLNPVLHMDILNKAFELAITTRGGGTARNSDLQDDASRQQRQRQ